MNRLCFIAAFCLLNFTHYYSLAAKAFNVLDLGAKGDDVTLDTAAIQRAIDAAAAAQGKVLIPSRARFWSPR